jgi:holo-[acyl-carrier protein] synthase
MIIGTGIDIIEILRIKSAIERWGDHFLNRVFTPQEIEHARKRAVPYPYFAGRFAAKEAVYKALGIKKVTWQDMTITNDQDGKPVCSLSNALAGSPGIHLSISHSKYYAIASAVVEEK